MVAIKERKRFCFPLLVQALQESTNRDLKLSEGQSSYRERMVLLAAYFGVALAIVDIGNNREKEEEGKKGTVVA